MTQLTSDISQILESLRQSAASLPSHRPHLAFMEVCGTHTMAAFRSGLHSLLPRNISLLSGPGCPVCVTAQGDIDLLISLAADRPVTLCTFGDMLRVPGHLGSLEQIRSHGADVRIVYSPLDAVQFASDHPHRQIVFAAVGFETTAPASAAAVKAAHTRNLNNFSILCLHKRVLPALLTLLASASIKIDGLILPGHVAVITGSQHFSPISSQLHLPCVVAGFEPLQIASALACLADLALNNRSDLLNLYPHAVTPQGNTVAQQLIDEIFQPCTAHWRGMGDIPHSGLQLRPPFLSFDAFHKFSLSRPPDSENPACICGQIITAHASPPHCKLFASACTPVHPLGPCMVSPEGTCAAWFKHKRTA